MFITFVQANYEKLSNIESIKKSQYRPPLMTRNNVSLCFGFIALLCLGSVIVSFKLNGNTMNIIQLCIFHIHVYAQKVSMLLNSNIKCHLSLPINLKNGAGVKCALP